MSGLASIALAASMSPSVSFGGRPPVRPARRAAARPPGNSTGRALPPCYMEIGPNNIGAISDGCTETSITSGLSREPVETGTVGQSVWKLTMISKPIIGRSPGIRHGTAGKSPVRRGRQEIAVLINYH